MRVPDEMYVEWVEGEAVVLNRESGELHYLNGPAALVFALIQECGYEAALRELHQRFGSADGMREQLDDLINDMVDTRLLVEAEIEPEAERAAARSADGIVLDESGEPRAAAG